MKLIPNPVILSFPFSLFSFFQKIDNFCTKHTTSPIIHKKYEKEQIFLEKKKKPSVSARHSLSYTNYQTYLNELNKTQVYLIVRNSGKKNENNLLLIQSQERLSGEKWVDSKLFEKLFLKSRQKGYHFYPPEWYNLKTFEVYRGLRVKRMVRPLRSFPRSFLNSLLRQIRKGKFGPETESLEKVKRINIFAFGLPSIRKRIKQTIYYRRRGADRRVAGSTPGWCDSLLSSLKNKIAKPPKWTSVLPGYFRGGNFYFPNNLGGYKSIAPVFFDQETANTFLTDVFEPVIEFCLDKACLTRIHTSSRKKLLKKILQTKIISLGLGDLIEFYSSSPNQEALKNTEFLFFPASEDFNKKSKRISLPLKKKGMVVKTFDSYQEKLLAYKSET